MADATPSKAAGTFKDELNDLLAQRFDIGVQSERLAISDWLIANGHPDLAISVLKRPLPADPFRAPAIEVMQ